MIAICVAVCDAMVGWCPSNGACYAVRAVILANSFGSLPDLRVFCPFFRGKTEKKLGLNTGCPACSDNTFVIKGAGAFARRRLCRGARPIGLALT